MALDSMSSPISLKFRTPLFLSVTAQEIRLLFYSPVAWVILVIFILHSSSIFVERIEDSAIREFTIGSTFYSLTERIFAFQGRGLFDQLLPYIALYVPLLTMGVFAKDASSGAERLLRSAPITVFDIVIGKFSAVSIYFSLFAAFLLILLVISGTYVSNIEVARVIVGVLGVYLLILTYSAIGIFVSSLTSHQIVAAIGTLVLIGSIDLAADFASKFEHFGSVAQWLAITDRPTFLTLGLVRSEDIGYFFIVIGMLLGLSVLRLSAARQEIFSTTFIAKASFCGCLILAAILLSTKPGWAINWDSTRSKTMTVSPGVQRVMQGFEGGWSVTAYVNVLNEGAVSYLPSSRNVLTAVFSQIARQNPFLQTDIVFYYGGSEPSGVSAREPEKSVEYLARQWARQNGVAFEAIRTAEEIRAEVPKADSLSDIFYKINWNDVASYVRTFDDSFHVPFEAEIGHGIAELFSDRIGIGFAKGAGERSAFALGSRNLRRAFTDAERRSSLVNRGFDIIEISLSEPVPRSVDLLVIAAPSEVLSEEVLVNFRDYVQSGRDILILTEPEAWPGISPILREFGIEQTQSIIRQPRDGFQSSIVFPVSTDEARSMNLVASEMVNERYGAVTLDGVVGLRVREAEGINVLPVFILAGEVECPIEEPEDCPRTVGMAITPEKEGRTDQRIFVLGDADAFSSAIYGTGEPEHANNWLVFNELLRWLTSNKYPIDISRAAPTDNQINISLVQVNYIRIALLLGLPILVGAAGFFLLRFRAIR